MTRHLTIIALSLLLGILPASGRGEYEVRGPQGGISMKLTLPDGFNPETDTCPMVILMHGIFSSKDFAPMPYLAGVLAKEGIASIRFDFGGHGRSEGEKVHMTIAREIEEARAIWAYAKSLPYVSDYFVLGHSQGGVVASMLAGLLAQEGADVPDGLLLLAPGEVIKEATRAGTFFGQKFDPADPPEYIKCWGLYKLGRDYLVQTQDLDIYGVSSCYQGPVRLIHGDRDGIVPLWCSEKYHEIYDNSDLHVVEGENHMIIRRKKEVARLVVEFVIRVSH